MVWNYGIKTLKSFFKKIKNYSTQASKVKDWQERTEALVVKRRADREALKDAERNRIQLQSLEEFKVRIMEQHADVKKELRDERKRREDLAEEFDTFREDMGEARVFLMIFRFIFEAYF